MIKKISVLRVTDVLLFRRPFSIAPRFDLASQTPKGEKTQPTLKTYALLGLGHTMAEISDENVGGACGFSSLACSPDGVIHGQAALR